MTLETRPTPLDPGRPPSEPLRVTARDPVEAAVEPLLRPFRRRIGEVLEAFLEATAGQMLRPVDEAMATVVAPGAGGAAGPAEERIALLEDVVARLDRGLRHCDLREGTDDLIEALSGTLSLPERAPARLPSRAWRKARPAAPEAHDGEGSVHALRPRTPPSDAYEEVEIPLRALAKGVVERQLLLPLNARIDEAMMPVAAALQRVRGFLARAADGPAEAADVEAAAAEVAASAELLVSRRAVWVSGLCDELSGRILAAVDGRRAPRRASRRSLRRATDRAGQHADRYAAVLGGMLGSIEAELELRRAEHRLVGILEARIFVHARRVATDLADQAEVITKALKASHDRIERAWERGDVDALRACVTTQRDQLKGRIGDQALEIADTLANALASAVSIEDLRTDLLDVAHDLPETIDLVPVEGLDALAKGQVPESVPTVIVRAPGQAIVVSGISWQVTAARERLMASMRRAREMLRQAQRMVAFNLDSALQEIERCEEADDLRAACLDVAAGAMQRAAELVDPLADELRREGAYAEASLSTDVTDAMQELRRIVLGRRELSSAAGAGFLWWRQMNEAAAEARERLAALARSLAIRGRTAVVDNVDRVQQRRASRRDPSPHGVADPEEAGRAREESLPHAYRMLFASEPVPSSDLLVGRTEPLARIAAAARRVSAGHAASLVVVGPPGIGRSSVVTVARETVLGSLSTHLIALQPGATEERLVRSLAQRFGVKNATRLVDLVAPLRRRREPTAVILDDLQVLFRRAPGGLSVLGSLAHVITETSERVLWIVTVPSPLWRFLGVMGRVPQVFTDVVHLAPLSEDEIGSMILGRHALSGYRLEIEDLPWRVRAAAMMRRGRGEQSLDLRAVLHAVATASEGNPELAALIWRRAIEPTGDGHLRMGLPRRPEIQPIYDEDLDALTTLATLLLEGSLTAAEHAHSYGWSEAQSERMLLVLRQRGWVRLRATGAPEDPLRFEVARALRLPLARLLARRGMLA